MVLFYSTQLKKGTFVQVPLFSSSTDLLTLTTLTTLTTYTKSNQFMRVRVQLGLLGMRLGSITYQAVFAARRSIVTPDTFFMYKPNRTASLAL